MIDTISYRLAVPVTPSDTTGLKATRGLFIGSAGDVTVLFTGDGWQPVAGPVTFKNVPDATFLPIRVTKVMAATAAGDILALY